MPASQPGPRPPISISNSRFIGIPHALLLWLAVWGAPAPRFTPTSVAVAIIGTINLFTWHWKRRWWQTFYFTSLIAWLVSRAVSAALRNNLSTMSHLFAITLYVVLAWDLYRLWLRRVAEGV